MSGPGRQFCGQCGAPIAPGEPRCARCGTPVGDDAAPAPAAPSKSGGGRVSPFAPTLMGNSHQLSHAGLEDAPPTGGPPGRAGQPTRHGPSHGSSAPAAPAPAATSHGYGGGPTPHASAPGHAPSAPGHAPSAPGHAPSAPGASAPGHAARAPSAGAPAPSGPAVAPPGGTVPLRPGMKPTMPLSATPVPGGPGALPPIALPSGPHTGPMHGGPGMHSESPFVAQPSRRRRWWAAVPLLLVVVIVAGALIAWYGFPLQTRQLLASQGLRTGVGKSRVAGFPAQPSGEHPRFRRRLVEPEEAPADLSLATPAYRVDPTAPSTGPFEISLPLLDPDVRKRVVIGRWDDGEWVPLPTARDGDHVIASTESLSTFAGWFARRRRAPTESQRASLRIPTPRLLYGTVDGERLGFHVDLRGLDTAVDPEEPWAERVAVRGLHVEVARPGAEAFTPYAVEGGNLLWSPAQAVGIVPVALAAVDGAVTHDAPVTRGAWRLRVVPVFDEGLTGTPTEPVELYPDVLRALGQMTRSAPWPEPARAAFVENAGRHPVSVIVGPDWYLQDAYQPSLPWSRQRAWGWIRAGLTGPQIGLSPGATWGDVLAHQWGHYAIHMALGDEYYEASPAAGRAPWTERSRATAFSEDLATFLGEHATGNGVPQGAGAMRGHRADLARHPAAADAAWPRDRGLDALAVETVPATVLSRLAGQVGASTVLTALLSSRATELLPLVDALPGPHQDHARRIMMDEGVSWRMSGQVVRGGAPAAGATVEVRVAADAVEVPEADRASVQATTGADGRFVVRVPYGEVQLVASADGRTSAPVTVRADASQSTAAPPQAIAQPLALN